MKYYKLPATNDNCYKLQQDNEILQHQMWNIPIHLRHLASLVSADANKDC